MGPICTPPRAGSSFWPRGDSIQDGGTKRTTLHLYTAFSSLHCPAGAQLPLPGENQPYWQKLAGITDSHTACRQTGIGQIFSLEFGGHSKPLVELFHGVYGWVRKVGERAEISRVELCSPRAGKALAPFSFFQRCHLQLHSPCSVPSLTVMLSPCVCFPRTGNAGLRFSSFLEVSKQHL